MQTAAAVTSRMIRQPRMAACRKFVKPSLLRRFQHFVESTDWDERYLCHPGVDKVCLGVIAVSVFYFVPVLLPIFLK